MPKNNLLSFLNAYTKELTDALAQIDIIPLQKTMDLIAEVYLRGGSVFIFGNGGSASTASHFACDLSKGTLARLKDKKEVNLKAISLTDNVPLITAFGNDMSYDEIFLQQLKIFLQKGDLLIVITGSGNSKNIIRAAKFAKAKSAHVVAMSGFKTGGEIVKIADSSFIIQSTNYGPIEDAHMVLCHVIVSWFSKLKRELEGSSKNENKNAPFVW